MAIIDLPALLKALDQQKRATNNLNDKLDQLLRMQENIYSSIVNDVVNTIRHENMLSMTLSRFYALNDSTITIWCDDIEVKFYIPEADLDLVQRSILQKKEFYDYDVLEFVRRSYGLKDSIVIDAGENIGNHTVFFSKICGVGKCISFEPNRRVSRVLKKNIEINNLSGVEVLEEGISDHVGQIFFSHQDSANVGGTSFSDEGSGGGLPCRTLDSLQLSNVDFIKVDVEGMASKVIKGAMDTLAQSKPPVQIELFHHEKSQTIELFDKLGYVIAHEIRNTEFFFEHPLRK